VKVRFYHVDVGGYTLDMVCSGTGSPTVVFEAGSGADWSTWYYVMPGLLLRPSAVAHLRAPGGVRYCAYSRAGNGTSQRSPYPRDSKTIVRELHTLLTRARIGGPYILVAHSMGGLYVRLYAYTYPRDVVGMVLVDSVHEDQNSPLTARDVEASCARPGQFSQAECMGWPQDQVEGDAARRARGPHPLGHLPLVVLTATATGYHAASLAVWLKFQKDLATLSTNSGQLFDPLSTHFIQMDQPDFVIEALQTVDAVRQHRPLPPVRAWRCGDGSGVCR
jgi:pimeloyl-ACP methyl ester carboxylesterase